MEVGSSLHAVETVILLLLVLVAGFAAMARRIQVPYPIVLVLAGLIISFLPRMPRVPLDPDVVFVVFLPPLLYASAWAMSWREFRRNAIVIGLLAFGLVGFTVWGVSFFSEHFITALDWKAGFLLGAVAMYTAFALLLEDSRHREVLPIGRQGAARQATHGTLASELRDIERAAGVRSTL